MTSNITYLTGSVLDENMECSLAEICRLCNIPAEMIEDMIDEGLICPRGEGPVEWRFTIVEFHRIQVSLRLQRDLRVNLPGCALVLDLLDELENLRRAAASAGRS
ncbi:MAG: chaperone modulator CbpM [Desulfobulbaceae bacterium]|nr:chaperone modulator CbpM [Desulfobulbaceae bacterium]